MRAPVPLGPSRPQLGLRARIVLTAAAATATALALVLAIVGPSLRARALEGTRQTLFAEARLMARVVEEPLARGVGSDELDPLVDDAARQVQARVTIVAPDGRVLADSAASGADLAALENHASRPEVRAAMATGAASSVRHSATVGEDLLYAAVAVRRNGVTVGISRVSLSLRGVEEQVSHLRAAVVVALLVAFALTLALSAVLSAPLAGPVQEIMDAARRFATGDLTARSRVSRRDELGELARILDRSADQLQDRLTEIARDRARTEAILASMDHGLLAVDHRGIVLLANPALRRSLDLHEPVGRHYLEVIRQRQVGEVLEAVLRAGERRSLEVEIPHVRRTYALTGVPFPGEEGAPPGAVLTFHDITDRRLLEQVRRDFVANASHELRTPLTSIRGFVEALEDGALGEPSTAARFLAKVRTHAERMAALVEDLLELSRLESGERPARIASVSPDEVAREVVASFSSLATRREVTLHVSEGAAPLVLADEERLRRILENLVDNALKYTPSGGHVEVASRAADGGGAVLEVVDDGPGIEPEHLPRIFERFYRVDKARSRELGGTGLGLSIVKHLAESMGARVTVESEPGRGSRFRVVLPVSAGTSASSPPDA